MMNERGWLTERFEQHRSHLRAVAYRMLGSVSEADDALQEAWLRIRDQDPASIENDTNSSGSWENPHVVRNRHPPP